MNSNGGIFLIVGSNKSLAILLVFFFFLVERVNGQIANREYAGVTPSVHTVGTASVTYASEAADQDENPAYTTVRYDGLQAGLQLKFNKDLSPNTTTFIKIDNPQLESGYVVDAAILTPLLGNLIRAEAYAGAGAQSSQTGTKINDSNVKVELVTDVNDKWFLAVTSSQKYNAVRIYLKYISQVGPYSTGSGYSMSVYYAFYLKPVKNDCGGVWATSAGIMGYQGQNLLNRHRSVDAGVNTFSTLQTLSDQQSAIQTIYFNTESDNKDEQVKIVLSIPSGALVDAVFDKITFQLYDGETAAGASYTLSSLMSGDLIVQCSAGQQVIIGVPSGSKFDRIKITAGHPSKINIHKVNRVAKAPSFTAATGQMCEDGSFTLKVGNDPKTIVYWYDRNKVRIPGTDDATQYKVTNLAPGSYLFYISATIVGCTEETPLVPATITVYPKPGPPSIQLQ